MDARVAVLVLAVAAALTGCGSSGATTDPVATSAASVVRVIEPYKLYVHCGIREDRIGDTFYAATPVMDDGSGNPPKGWDNPYQTGTMTVYDDGTARFTATGGLEATFKARPGATDWLMICS
jgi:hypothetical protein